MFTPTNANYLAATKTVNLVVNKAVLTVTANNQTIAFGGSVAPYTDSITGFVNGDAPSVVTGAPSLSTTPASPTAAGTYPITAAQGTLAAANYSFTFVPGTLTITKINPTVTWANPAGIVFGTALSGTQLNATASVPGTFTYTPAAGSIPAAGTDTLSVTFKPTDTTDYNTITQTVQVVVSQATPPITWATPSPITYGTALSAFQLNATSTVVGTFVYTPAAGTVPTAGTQTLSVTFTPTDAADYTPVTKTVQLVVNQATPVVTWTPPTAITYGTALSNTQLNATASVPGSFAYTPAAGAVLMPAPRLSRLPLPRPTLRTTRLSPRRCSSPSIRQLRWLRGPRLPPSLTGLPFQLPNSMRPPRSLAALLIPRQQESS